MKIAIVYKSVTGNTKLVAEAIREALADQDVVYVGEPRGGLDADFYFVGSWTDKGNCAEVITGFLKTLEHKKIAFFGTAGFGGSAEYYQALYARVSAEIPASDMLAEPFYCQGKMPMAVRDRYVKLLTEHPDDKQLQVSVDNFDRALNHPDEIDLQTAKDWAVGVAAEFK